MKLNWKKLAVPAILTVSSAAAYWRWLNFKSFTDSDWLYISASNIRLGALASIWATTSNFGDISLMLWRWPLNQCYAASLAISGQGGEVGDKICVFWPIAFLVPLAAYLLISTITRSRLGGFIGSLVLSYNTYFLAGDTQGHQMIHAAGGFSILAVWSYIEAVRRDSLPYAVASALFVSMAGAYDFRVAYMTCMIWLAYFIFDSVTTARSWRARSKQIVVSTLPVMIFGLLQAFWVLPTKAADRLVHNPILSRGLFGDQFWNLPDAILNHHPFWTGWRPEWFVNSPAPIWQYALVLAALVGLYLHRRNSHAVFFGALTIIGIFLIKQSEPPFEHVYGWLINHVPGFSAFREASKFYFFTSIGYAVLTGFLSVSLRDWRPATRSGKALRFVIPASIVLFTFGNAIPFMADRMGGMYSPRERPAAYEGLESLLEKDQDHYRVLAVPTQSHWHFTGTFEHPEVDLGFLYLRAAPALPELSLGVNQERGNVSKIFDSVEFDHVLDQAGVRYVYVMPPYTEKDGTIFEHPSSGFYRRNLPKKSYLRRVETGVPGLEMYENEGYESHLQLRSPDGAYLSAVENESGMGVRYDFTLRNLRSPVVLRLTEDYNVGWRLYSGVLRWYQAFDENAGVISRPSSEIGLSFNEFLIDPAALAENKAAGLVMNADGSYDVSYTLYFRPQGFLVLGMIISAAALFGSLAYLCVAMIYRLRKSA